MGKLKTSEKDIELIRNLRRAGKSLPDIAREVHKSKTTIFRYIKDIKIPQELKYLGSRRKCKEEWNTSMIEAENLIKNLDKQDRMLILAAIYWGEGNKREVSIINSDPELLRVFLNCIFDLGVKEDDLKVSLRIYNGVIFDEARDFWSKVLNFNRGKITCGEKVKGVKKGKLNFGMCRIRVLKSKLYFKTIMSMINLIKKRI